jgi:DNA segregation ATPase FtsK/SpoIIIE-like protein
MNLTTSEYFTFNVDNSLLLVGQTGSGKSVLQDELIRKLVASNSPETLQFVLLDMTSADYWDLRQDHKEFIKKYVAINSDEGLDVLDEMAALSEKRKNQQDPLPQLFICIEECDMAVLDQSRFDKALITINANAKKANMKLIYSTSRIGEQTISKDLMKRFDLILAGLVADEETETFLGVPKIENRENYTFYVIENRND